MPTPKRARDAKTGRFTTLKYALRHPATSVIETVKRWKWKRSF